MKRDGIPVRVFLSALVIVSLVFAGCAGGLSRREAAKLYYNLGNAYLEIGDNAKASNAYLKSLEYDKNMKIASLNLARAYIEVGKYTEAVKILDRMLSDEGDNTIVLSAKAYCLYRSGDLEAAYNIYSHILEIDSGNTAAGYNMAAILSEQEKYDDALQTLSAVRQKAADDEQLFSDINSLFGEIYYKTGQYEQSIEYLEYIGGKEPDNIENMVLLFNAQKESRYFASAIETGNRILQAEPENSTVLFDMALIYLTAVEDVERGLQLLEASVSSGFSDREKAEELLGMPGMESISEVRAILEKEKLVD